MRKRFPIGLALILLTRLSLAAEGPAVPAWVAHPPEGPDLVYFVGATYHADNKEAALEKAWVSAFVQFGTAEFPELSSFRLRATETLTDESLRKEFVARLEAIDWAGVSEAKELGSPFLAEAKGTKGVDCYRLLRWSRKDLTRAHREVSQKRARGAIHDLPESPELQSQRDASLVEAVRQIRTVNRRIESQNARVVAVLREARCGVTAADLISILGGSDRVASGEDGGEDYYWGSYRVHFAPGKPEAHSFSEAEARTQHRFCEHAG